LARIERFCRFYLFIVCRTLAFIAQCKGINRREKERKGGKGHSAILQLYVGSQRKFASLVQRYLQIKQKLYICQPTDRPTVRRGGSGFTSCMRENNWNFCTFFMVHLQPRSIIIGRLISVISSEREFLKISGDKWPCEDGEI
jgi:hypothetical protein